MYHIPQNPCCTPPAPATPCSSGDPCSAQPIPTQSVSYSGPNLPCTGIHTCDSVTVALQKIDEQICSLQDQIYALEDALGACCTTTTTTSTTVAPTTTTTTTIACPSCNFYAITNSTLTSVDIVYYACGGSYISTCLVGPTTIYVCACTGSVVVPPVPGVSVSNVGACPTTTTTTTVVPPTTTTTSTSTTTTTTTLLPGACVCFSIKNPISSVGNPGAIIYPCGGSGPLEVTTPAGTTNYYCVVNGTVPYPSGLPSDLIITFCGTTCNDDIDCDGCGTTSTTTTILPPTTTTTTTI